jgi:hypothetical protein
MMHALMVLGNGVAATCLYCFANFGIAVNQLYEGPSNALNLMLSDQPFEAV